MPAITAGCRLGGSRAALAPAAGALPATPLVSEIIGWLSSAILVVTLAKQVHKQWREGQSDGVSPWLYRGQIAASIGFTIYSVQVKNWVFVVTNGLLLVNALVGYLMLLRQRRAKKDAG